ncbi:nucleoside kinase [Heliobacterium gestii]|uniref:Nucleoside kinase n=1 Tax=Heliomicrobium gestii TaxID=2699 RepID=A0A845LCA3_HELGE|nr:nucleoside kinase [Heliomicrobium gestii]MBM7866850.1 uridine kinase [Heliomicrobium gestii]MZP42279.1 nucleoside kinase [Heliomicrobium gestii]
MNEYAANCLGLTVSSPKTGFFCRWWNRRLPLQALAWELQPEHPAPIVAVRVDNVLEDLAYVPEGDCLVEMVDMSSETGLRVYGQSLAFVLMRVARELYPGRQLEVQFSLNKGFYGELLGDQPLTEEMVDRLRERMWEVVRAAEPIDRQVVSRDEALHILEAAGRQDQADILRFRSREPMNIYTCGGYVAYSDEILVPHTGMITTYQLVHHYAGFLLRHPDQSDPYRIPPNVEQKQLAYIFRESDKWTKIVKVGDVRDLNGHIGAEKTGELIRIAEALHEKKIAQIADRIAEDPDKARLILIAGPSSSGKTTFAQRLKIQLRVNGLDPVTLSIDDYFLPRAQTPRDGAGNYDFESIDAVDCALFNDHLMKLIAGEAVEIPRYNFHTGDREFHDDMAQAGIDRPIIVEGIHGLNEKLTAAVARDHKFKIYVSALMELNLTPMNYIKTTDARCIRRIVRDHQFRSHDALRTLTMWPSVRRGEERWIFPFQEEADIMFNSALVYELAVLARYAAPLLEAISRDSKAYGEAQRLLTLLDYFRPMGDVEVPHNSILREFIGGSCFF